MNSRRALLPILAIYPLLFPVCLYAVEQPPLVIDNFKVSGSTRSLNFEPVPSVQSYTFFSGTNPGALTVNTNFFQAPYITGFITNLVSGTNQIITNVAYEWRLTNVTAPSGFYRVGSTPMNPNSLLSSTVLNRLAYGPTPDELDRVNAIGPDAYIAEQLNMNGVVDTLDNYSIETGNSAAMVDSSTNWIYNTATGTVASTMPVMYLFSTLPGEGYFDDFELKTYRYYYQITTNIVSGTNVYVTNRAFSHISGNLLTNGDFELGYLGWTNAGAAGASGPDNTRAHSGSSCLRMISTSSATGAGVNHIRQGFTNVYWTTNTWGDAMIITNLTSTPAFLTYWYQPTTTSTNLRVQFGSGINFTPAGLAPPPTWVYATATGTANANSRLYIYLSGAGEAYVDDVVLVAGTNAGVGPNLLQNGGFESSLAGTWTTSADFVNSALTTTVARSGSSSLRLVATAAGSGNSDSVQQNVSPALVNGQTYTVSFWYVPATQGRTLTVKLDGNILQSTPDVGPASLARRLDAGPVGWPGTTGLPQLSELRAWFCFHAVQSPRQLFEVLSQFWENHFVTQHAKSQEYLDNLGYDSGSAAVLATDWEYREITKWRNAMLNPNCTFYDLLRISVESPAMIVYLDTVNSRGNGANIANENYARELLELFTMGVDNGYDQNDIVLMSRAWTGWSVELVDEANINNPFAPASVTYYPGTNSTAKVNTIGKWAFKFKEASHGTNRGDIFGGKTVPPRFGPPWAGMPYKIALPPRGAVTNGIQDGYDVIVSLANNPFTAEYISVKLCRLFVHDNFPNPSSHPETPEYQFYDYTNPNRSEEAELVHQCMLAWENSSPKGNLRAVLATIFNSELFRTHAAAAQKVKTPLEFVASAVRALRANGTNGSPTAVTDGYSFVNPTATSPLARMGGMLLFDRAAPDGYPEAGEPWISSGTLVERIRHIQALLTSGTGDDAGNHTVDPIALMLKKIPTKTKDAAAVADYFLGILYPGEGAGNLAQYRSAAIAYLNTDDAGASSPFANLQFSTTANTTYDYRVRGMVAMLMAYPRFQEQ